MLDFSASSLVDVIAHYRRAGYQIYYSEALVKINRGVAGNPPNDAPVNRLNRILTEFDLALREQEDGSYLIVYEPHVNVVTKQTICDSISKLGIFDAKISTKLGARYRSNRMGRLNLPGSDEVDSITHPDYFDLILDRDSSTQSNSSCDYEMTPIPKIEELIVPSSRYILEEGFSSKASIEGHQLGTVPELGGDALRIINRLPGASGVGVSAKPYIRGGAQDELLVLFNNIELIEPFHLKDFQSVFSGLNPVVVDTIDVYTGGFPARYGNRMSGVMDVSSKRNHDSNGGELNVSLYSASLAGFGNYAQGYGNWSGAFRRGNLDLVTKEINPAVGEPSYYDAYLMTNYTTQRGDEFEFGWMTYVDDIKLQSLEEEQGTSADSRYENHYLWAQYYSQISPGLDSRSTLSVAIIDNDRSGFINEPEPDEGVGTLFDRKNFELIRLHTQLNLESNPRVRYEFGAGIEYLSSEYDYEFQAELGELSQILGRNRTVTRSFHDAPGGIAAHAYISHQRALTESITVDAGLRWDFQDYYFGGSDYQISPRINFLYELNADTDLRIGVGRFYQAEGIHELQVESMAPKFQKIQYSDQIIAGFAHKFNQAWSVRVETYYKRVGQPKIRYENLFNSLILLPELSADRIEVAARRVRTRGVEFALNYRTDSFDSWFNATVASADDDLRDLGWTARAWDQRTTIGAGFVWQRQSWSLSGAVVWHSGWKTTRLPLYLPDLDNEVLIDRNSGELPDFFSIDLRYAHEWQWPHNRLEVFAELTNTTDRRNVGSVEVELTPATNGFTSSHQNENLFPRVPSIGFVWQF